jgi:uncharacterized membrane protein (DUF2068 family)
MERRRRWFNPAQPQTLQIAIFLLYINAAFLLFDMLIAGTFPPILLAIVAAQVTAGVGIANEKKWAYWLGLAMAIFPFAFRFYFAGNPLAATSVLSLMFEIALVALLLHPQSRDYQRIWFK